VCWDSLIHELDNGCRTYGIAEGSSVRNTQWILGTERMAIQEPSSILLTSFDNLVENCIDAKSAIDTIILVIT
jgi:hypothetical protein